MLNEYNPQALEEFIDGSRNLNDWESVTKGIERYAHLFDVGAASYTQQHNEIHEIRSYYWVCMAQVVFYTKKDYNNAIDCARRAIDFNRSNIDALVILCQILLTVSSKFLINSKDNLNELIETSNTNQNNDQIYMKNIEYMSIILLQDILIDLPKSEQNLLLNILDSGSFTVKNCTLAVLNSFSSKDMKLACTDVLFAIRQPSRLRPSLEQLLRIWILSICKNLLAKISLNTVLMRYISDNMSDYLLWLLLDGVLTRIHILETLNDVHQARAEIINLLTEMISPFHSGFMKLPKRCKHMIAMEAFRLPFLEMQVGLDDEAIESFKECSLDSGMYTPYAPIPIRITHAVFAAVLLLKRAKKSIENVNEYHEETCNIDVDDAFSLLLSAYKFLSMKVDLSRSNILSIHDFSPSLSSLKLLLPPNDFDIDAITNMAVWSRVIGMLIVTIVDNFKNLSANFEDKNGGLDILEHCLTLDLHANSDYLWYIANKYKAKNKISYACDFLIQAHDAIVEERTSPFEKECKNIDLSLDYQDILKWLLPNKLLPSLHAWVPIVTLVDTLLNNANDAKKALDFAHKGLSLFSDRVGQEILKFIESNQIITVPFLVLDGLNNQFDVSEILSMSGSIDKIVKDYSSNSMEDQDLLGLYELAYLIGSCHRSISEKRNLSYSDKFQHSCLALKSFMLLYSSSSLPISSKILSTSSISLNYAICLANVGECSKALEIIDNAIIKSDNDDTNIAALLHFKAILLCSENNISQLFPAQAACEQAVLKGNSLNAKLTLSLIELSIGNIKKALQIVDEAVDALTAPSRQILQWLHNEKTINTNRNVSRVQINHNQHDNSIDKITKKDMLIELLLTCSYIFRKSSLNSKAKTCLEEAWQLLYLTDNIENIVESNIKDARISTYHRRIDIIRKIPTLMGWKIFSGSGFGANIDNHIEADILTEAGNILMCENDSINQAHASELFSFAISICPDHIPCLIALTNIELSNANNISGNDEEVIIDTTNNYSKAFSFAVKAINNSPMSSMNWYTLGKVLEEMNMKKEAAQSYLSTITCTKYCTIRRHAIVNYDKFF